MNKAYWVGIDVAKMTLAIALHKHAEPQVHLKVSNDLKGIECLILKGAQVLKRLPFYQKMLPIIGGFPRPGFRGGLPLRPPKKEELRGSSLYLPCHYLTVICLVSCLWAGSFLGRCMARIPSVYWAAILSASTASGNVKDLLKV